MAVAQAKIDALKAAGCPDAHCEALAALGLTPADAKKLAAAGFDWSKLIAALPQIIALVLGLFNKPPTP